MIKRIRKELVAAIIMAFALSALAVYMNQPTQTSNFSLTKGSGSQADTSLALRSQSGLGSSSNVQQTVRENIRGELRKDTFETVISGLRNLTSLWGGIVPYLSMVYESESWSGTMTCSVPTENVADFTFGVRKLINDNGKVTYITVSVIETIVNQTGLAENQFSDVSIGLTEPAGGGSPVLSQVGLVVPWLVNGLVLVAQGLIIGVPLCFVSLGIVIMVDRAIIPTWKKQFKSRSLRKATSGAQREIGVQSSEN
jgi:hypothetical protein